MLGGKDRGKKGKIVRVFSNEVSADRVIVEGLNLIKKHTRARKQGQKGQIIHKERPVSISSVALICKACGRPTRVGYRFDDDQKLRICKKCGAVV